MTTTGGRYRMLFVSAALAVFLTVSVAGIVAIGSEVGPHGIVSHCPLMSGMSSLCQMGPLEHVVAWQSMFSATFDTNGPTTLILLLIASIALSALFVRRKVYSPSASALQPAPMRYLSHVASLDPLREALANGIMHPKVYE